MAEICGDTPHSEDTGVWIPVSVPPMFEDERNEWDKGFHKTGGYFLEGDMGWGDIVVEDKEMTMWDVVTEMLIAARAKLDSLATDETTGHISLVAQTLTDANSTSMKEVVMAEPPRWLADSASSTCMLCDVRFHPLMCTRHHCRFCGGLFCGDCSKGRSLLPYKFRVSDPQRVCDACYVRLESIQPYLMDRVSHAAQLPTHDLTDLSTLRSWVNFPWGQSMQYEIYKAANTIQTYQKVCSLTPEKAIPDWILRDAKGLAIISTVKVGVMVTYNIGTGIVIARNEDDSWSAPSAVSTFGIGWGAQAGGELTDFIIVLRSIKAVKTFCSAMHLAIGAGLSAAVGVGRAAEADIRAGDGGFAARYTYSCTKGAFVGCSLEGSLVATRSQVNAQFYGRQSISATKILLGSLPRPPAAAVLYRALGDLYNKIQR